ncbi:hypothetical protein PCAR4_910020 [Paraburkholderia caribensis]|nr:hypothetical protein PCAR4_910020 [Paraburkholderia caribensis]
MLAVNVAADFTRTYPDYFRFVFLIFFDFFSRIFLFRPMLFLYFRNLL